MNYHHNCNKSCKYEWGDCLFHLSDCHFSFQNFDLILSLGNLLISRVFLKCSIFSTNSTNPSVAITFYCSKVTGDMPSRLFSVKSWSLSSASRGNIEIILYSILSYIMSLQNVILMANFTQYALKIVLQRLRGISRLLAPICRTQSSIQTII